MATLDFTAAANAAPVNLVTVLSLEDGSSHWLQNIDSRYSLRMRFGPLADGAPERSARGHEIDPGEWTPPFEVTADEAIWCWTPDRGACACVVSDISG